MIFFDLDQFLAIAHVKYQINTFFYSSSIEFHSLKKSQCNTSVSLNEGICKTINLTIQCSKENFIGKFLLKNIPSSVLIEKIKQVLYLNDTRNLVFNIFCNYAGFVLDLKGNQKVDRFCFTASIRKKS